MLCIQASPAFSGGGGNQTPQETERLAQPDCSKGNTSHKGKYIQTHLRVKRTSLCGVNREMHSVALQSTPPYAPHTSQGFRGHGMRSRQLNEIRKSPSRIGNCMYITGSYLTKPIGQTCQVLIMLGLTLWILGSLTIFHFLSFGNVALVLLQ